MLLITGVLALFVAFSVSAFCCWWIVQHKRDYWLDQPNDRSLHTVPVPRLGGVGIWSGVVVGGIIGVQGFFATNKYLLSGVCHAAVAGGIY
jgi:UDP-N-acetylmuramyl pentapeptide phosphotransferase/UDP-N-acetylglucosamine-1-phosphate transferase